MKPESATRQEILQLAVLILGALIYTLFLLGV